jgi:solute carrier family 25 folate transporter 32
MSKGQDIQILGTTVNPNAIAGFTAGFISSSVLYPLEVVKSRFQVGKHSSFSYRNTFNALSTIYSQQGIKELYRGFPAGLAGSSLSWGLYFWLYNEWKYSVAYFRGESKPSTVDHWTSSILASMAVQTILSPLWVVKLNQQLGHFESFSDGARQLMAKEGIRGFYRGLIPGYWSSSHFAIQFALYEDVRQRGIISNMALNTIFATVVSKTLAVVLTSPIEVVKVRMRSSQVNLKENIRSICTQIWHKEGMRGFYKGVGTALLRILPGQCLTFVTFELVKNILTS